MTDINRADQYENCTPVNVDDPMPISPFLTTTDVINQLNKQLSSLSYDECKDDCNADNDTDGPRWEQFNAWDDDDSVDVIDYSGPTRKFAWEKSNALDD